MIGFDFFLDRFGLFLSALFVFIGLMTFIYALATLKKKGHRLEFYLTMLLIVSSGVGVALSYNLLLIFICWEISTFALWRAIGFYREKEGLSAANFAFIINFTAASIMLIGLILLYIDNGTFNIFKIQQFNMIAVVLIMVGILAKSVTLPLHIWLVPAYKVIPSAIGGCLAGIAENLGVVLFLRLFMNGNFVAPPFFNTIAWIAIISSLFLVFNLYCIYDYFWGAVDTPMWHKMIMWSPYVWIPLFLISTFNFVYICKCSMSKKIKRSIWTIAFLVVFITSVKVSLILFFCAVVNKY